MLAAVGWEGSCGESARQAATLRALRCPGSGLLEMLRKCSRSDIFLVPTRSCRRQLPSQATERWRTDINANAIQIDVRLAALLLFRHGQFPPVNILPRI